MLTPASSIFGVNIKRISVANLFRIDAANSCVLGESARIRFMARIVLYQILPLNYFLEVIKNPSALRCWGVIVRAMRLESKG